MSKGLELDLVDRICQASLKDHIEFVTEELDRITDQEERNRSRLMLDSLKVVYEYYGGK